MFVATMTLVALLVLVIPWVSADESELGPSLQDETSLVQVKQTLQRVVSPAKKVVDGGATAHRRLQLRRTKRRSSYTISDGYVNVQELNRIYSRATEIHRKYSLPAPPGKEAGEDEEDEEVDDKEDEKAASLEDAADKKAEEEAGGGEEEAGGSDCSADSAGIPMKPVSGANEQHGIELVSASTFCAHKRKKKLGRGGTSHVSAGYDDANKPLTIKTYAKGKENDFHNEASVLAHLLKVPEHIVKLIGVSESKSPPYSIALERLMGKDLLVYMMEEHFSLKEAAKTIKQVLMSLHDCHANGVAHRDVKPENIVYAKDPLEAKRNAADADEGVALEDEEQVDGGTLLKLIDFGFAKWLPEAHQPQSVAAAGIDSPEAITGAKLRESDTCDGTWAYDKSKRPLGAWSWVGTPEYVSPELAGNFERKNKKVECTSFSAYAPDIWSLGIMAFSMTTKTFPNWFDKCPEDHKEHEHCMNKVTLKLTNDQVQEYTKLFDERVAEADAQKSIALDFIRKALNVDPNARPTASQLLSHAWMGGDGAAAAPAEVAAAAPAEAPAAAKPAEAPAAAAAPAEAVAPAPAEALAAVKKPATEETK